MKTIIGWVHVAVAVCVCMSGGLRTDAATLTWTGNAGNQNWFDSGNWDPTDNYPQAADTVIIPSGASVLLTNATAELAAFSIANAALTFSNWTTRLRATEVTIENNGTLTLPSPFTEAQMSNRVWVVCSNLTVNPGGRIDTDAKGFAGAVNADGNGPGKGLTEGLSNGPGAGHGGKGGVGDSRVAAGGVCGDAEMPTAPGSSGAGSSTSAGGHGGGAIRIEAAEVLMNGMISADGGNGAGGSYRSGGGSGGSVYIVCDDFTSTLTSAVIRANGGDGSKGNTSSYQSGGGGGGRIAINCDALDPETVLARFETRAGIGHDTVVNVLLAETNRSGMGTLYMPNANLLSPVLSRFDETRFVIPGFDTWGVSSLVISNSTVAFGSAGMLLTVTGNLAIVNGGFNLGGLALGDTISDAVAGASSGTLHVGGAVLMDGGSLCLGGIDSSAYSHMTVGGGMVLTNSSRLRLNASLTNDTTEAFGARVAIAGGLAIGSGCWIYPFSHSTNGGSVIIQAGSVSVSEGGGINADAKGFSGRLNDDGLGIGATVKANNTAGAGHGGRGGNRGALSGGIAYDSTNAPVQPGSSAGGTSQAAGGHGGGVIRLAVSGTVVNDGTITANGAHGDGANYRSGGGAGGSIFINCSGFFGMTSAARLSAAGGNGKIAASAYQSGGGAGGRISVAIGFTTAQLDDLIAETEILGLMAFDQLPEYAGSMVATGGLGYASSPPDAAEDGTQQFLKIQSENENVLLISADPEQFGDPSPNGYGTHLITDGTVVTNSVTSPTAEADGQRWSCTGWMLFEDGSPEAADSGTTAQAVFTLTNDASLTWHWTNEYYLTVNAGPQGQVTGSGWYTNGVQAVITAASTNTDYVFLQWDGGIPEEKLYEATTTLTLDRPRTVTALFVSPSIGVQRTWVGGSGNWLSAPSWDPSGIPGPLDDVRIPSGTVALGSPQTITSLMLTNATLIVSNWTTKLQAETVMIENNGIFTLASPFTEAQMSNRVWVVCSNLTVNPGGWIDADAKGFAGVVNADGNGPGKGLTEGLSNGPGAGHGGKGGKGTSGVAAGGVYGDAEMPIAPGSSGAGSSTTAGGHGGGAVLIEATQMLMNGAISANGGAGAGGSWRSGGGSGGSVYIVCDDFTSTVTSAVIRANGGDGSKGNTSSYQSGGGGGGRIAVWIGVPTAILQRYLLGNTNGVAMALANGGYVGAISVDPGVGYREPPHVDAADPGTAYFYTFTVKQGSMFMFR